MPQSAEDNLAFVLACWLSADANGGKTDFEAIASTLGLTKHGAYSRLWNLKKKAGFGTGGSNKQIYNPSPTATSGRKRGRPVGSGKGVQAKTQKVSRASVAKTMYDDEEDLVDEIDEEDEEGNDSDTKTLVKDEFKKEEV